MEELGPWCKHCGHPFKLHEQSTLQIWFCDYEDEFGYCPCNNFEPKRAAGTENDPTEVQYDSESYRWN